MASYLDCGCYFNYDNAQNVVYNSLLDATGDDVSSPRDAFLALCDQCVYEKVIMFADNLIQ